MVDGVADGVVDGVVNVDACAEGGVDVSSEVATESSSPLSKSSSSSEASGEAGGLSNTTGEMGSTSHHACPTHSTTTCSAQSVDPVMKKTLVRTKQCICTPVRMTGAVTISGEGGKSINDQKIKSSDEVSLEPILQYPNPTVCTS